ncbi:MAG: TonB-dependent receptor plug domain-containing protein [Proteobacteria bacterium]|nr:TonB-dependent receptor plug domain-containing protein [Pseudomonadota bacterium]
MGMLIGLLARPALGGDAAALNEVVVSARKPTVEQVGTVYQLDARDIEIRGARTLDEALALLPGVNVRTGGNGSPRIDVRGFRTRHVKLLLNGVPFGNTFDGQFDPTLIPSENIARIKLTTGASSTMYGDGAVAAVINVITRQAEQGQSATTHAEYGGGDFHRVSGSYAWGDGDSGVFVAGGRNARDGFPLAGGFDKTSLEHGGLRANSDRERNNAYLNFYHQVNPSFELGGNFTYARGGYGAPGTVVDDISDAFANRPRWQRVDDQETVTGQLSLAWTPGGRLSDRAWAYINTLDENTNRYSDPFAPTLDDVHVRGTFRENSDSRVVGVHNELSFEHDYGGAIKFMLEARHEHITQDCMTRDIPHLPPPPPPAPTPDPLTNATSATLDFNYLATNNYGATNSAGDNQAIARLTMTNNAQGGVDFSLRSLAAENFFTQGGSGPPIAQMYVSRLYLLPDQDLDISDWQFVRNPASQGSNGANANGFAAPGLGDIINNYHFRTQIGWQRPGGAGGAADPLVDGETALWSYSHARLAELLRFSATSTGGRPPAYAALELRQVDASGFWGPSEPPTGGPGGLAVFLVAPTSATALTGPKPPDPVKPITAPKAGSACGSGGDGSGGGQPTRFEQVSFGLRPFDQTRDLTIASGALEINFRTIAAIDVVLGYAEHWLQRDDGSSAFEGSFSASLGRALGRDWRVRAGVARKIRMPSVQQLYDSISGDPTLAPERAMTYEIGADYGGWRWADVGLTIFRSDVRNFIDRDPLTEEFANNQRIRFDGAELTASARLDARSRLEASYSYLDASDRSSTSIRDEMQYRPRHKVAMMASERFADDTELSATMQFVGGEYYFSRQGLPRTRMLDPYALFNLRVARPLLGPRIRVFVGADNLFDADYEQAYGLPQAGRLLYAGFDIKLL